MNRPYRLAALAVGALAFVAMSCGDATVRQQPDDTSSTSKPKDPLASGSSFSALTRDVSADEIASRQSALKQAGASNASIEAGSSFYLAIKKTSLKEKWFLSTYINQYFPGAVSGGASRSMGTRIVSFQIQNGKVFMFDASSNNQTSGTYNPKVLLDAYPIVTDNAAFNGSANASAYVLIDPSAGLNKFNLFSDWYGGAALPMTIDISFLQRFRAIADGATWEQVFTGQSNTQINDGTIEGNLLRASGTLGMSLRKYSEGAGFTETALPTTGEYFFRSEPHLVPNSGGAMQTAAKWNIKPGMKPIVWKLAHNVADVTNDPYFKQYDVVGALKGAVTAWNDVFGFEALKVEIGSATDSAGDDDTNYIVFDEDPTYGAAFANWRSNPNTGEIRGASIYFSSLWLYEADGSLEDDVGVPPSIKGNRPAFAVEATKPRAKPKAPMISWQPMVENPLCMMWAPTFTKGSDEAKEMAAAEAAMPKRVRTLAPMTKKQKVEALLMHILNHEVGHTLGLRHNFKGSLVPPTSSTMEYTQYDDVAHAPGPQSYDNTVVKLLYGLDTKLPTEPFCTDNLVGVDPDCTIYDYTADPLTELYGPIFLKVKNDYLKGVSPIAPNATANNLLKYVRAGKPAQVEAAWKMAFDGITPPIADSLLASAPAYGAAADLISWRLLTRMWSDPAAARGSFAADPPRSPFIMTNSLTQLSGNLNNLDKVRTFNTRRATVDILKYFQVLPAYSILSDGRTSIAAGMSTMTGTEKLLTQDLVARIDNAIAPYFVK